MPVAPFGCCFLQPDFRNFLRTPTSADISRVEVC